MHRIAIVAWALLLGCGTPKPALHPAALGGLGYHAAFWRGAIVSVELRSSFELVLRSRSGTARYRKVLGPADYDISGIAIDSVRDWIWVGSRDGTVRALELSSGELRRNYPLGEQTSAVAVSDDGEYLATATSDGVLCLRRIDDGALLQCLTAHGSEISDLDFHGARLASASHSGRIAIWSVPSLARQDEARVAGSANSIEFSPNGARVLVALSEKPPHRTPAQARREAESWRSPNRPLPSLALWSGGSQITVASGHRGPVVSVAWLDNERWLSASWDRTVRLWSSPDGPSRQIGAFLHIARSVAADRQRALAAAAGWTTKPHSPALWWLRVPGRVSPTN